MLKQRIEQYFNNDPYLKVLFFFDAEKEYLEEVKALELDDIHIEFYNDTPFTTKCKLLDELRHQKVFLYLSQSTPNDQDAYHDFPLLGLLLANKELRLDNVGEFMERYGIQRHQKNLVSKYIHELKYTGVQEVCAPILNSGKFIEPNIQRGLLSSFFKFKEIQKWDILIAKLLSLIEEDKSAELNRVLKKVHASQLEDEVLKQIKNYTGVRINNLNERELLETAKSVLYNSLTQNLDVASSDPYKSLKIDDQSQITQLNQMLFEVNRKPGLKEDFERILDKVSAYIKGETLIQIYGGDAEFSEFTTPMVWEIIREIGDGVIETPEDAISKLERISLQQGLNKEVKRILHYLIYTAQLHRDISSISTYVLNTVEEYTHKYTEEWYSIDKLFRKAISIYKKLDTTILPKNIELEKIHQKLNINYEKHVDSLNREWLKCLNHFKFDYKKIKVPKQYDFYNTEVANQDQKIVIIISDALRYEVGEELLSELHGDSKNTAEVRHMLASIPSKTNIGMAQLLPHKTVKFNEGDIAINDISNSSIENRSKILQLVNEEASAYSFTYIDGLDQKKNRDIFKKPLVYIYHDVIDSTGDKRASERRTFQAAEDAIEELKQFVKKLHSSYNVAKVLITADHGFIYNDRTIKEKEKEDLPKKGLVQSHNRYYLTEENSNPDLGYCIPLSATTIFDENLFVTIPASGNRYKKQGVGHQFVHGGGTLQELIVPLIESSRKREKVTKRVHPIAIYQGNLKVVSNILRVNILQENEVSRFEKARVVKIGLYYENELASNEVELKLDSTSESPSERMSRVELTLSNDFSDKTQLKLKIFDVEDTLNPLVEERVQNNTILPTDF